MITCPNCQHENPESATQCEACFTILPHDTPCPSCGAMIQGDSVFCGQCGYIITPLSIPEGEELSLGGINPDPIAVPPTILPDPMNLDPSQSVTVSPDPDPVIAYTPPTNPPIVTPDPDPTPPILPNTPPVVSTPTPNSFGGATQLQVTRATLRHLQTDTVIELTPHLSVLHIGKPNDRIPPDIDVSGFPDSDIVSRIHADIRVEGDAFYIEDVGSSNGTYINHTPLLQGNRHRLRTGDRVALGKGDKMTFLFQE